MAAMRLVRPLEWVCLTAEWPPRARRAAEREQHLRPIGQQLHTGLGAPRRVQAQPCPESWLLTPGEQALRGQRLPYHCVWDRKMHITGCWV